MDLSRSDWKYADERAGAFVGREWVFARVRSFLSGAPGTFLLRGDPGTGKTAVAARLAQASCGRLNAAGSPLPVGERAISAGVFCRAGKATVAELAQRLSDQLAASVDGFADALRATAEPGITIRDVRVDVRGDVHAGGTVSGVVLPRQDGKQAFSAGVAVPLRHLRERGAAEPVVLLVDAVDEAADVGEVNVFSRLLANLDDVHLIVTCRPDPPVLSDFRASAHKLDLIADAPADDDVRRYIRNRLTRQGPEGAVDVLARRVSDEADGNFLYAFYVTGTLTGSGSLAGMDEKAARGLPLPTGGLAGVYEDFLDRQIAGEERRWAWELRPVLAPLAVAQDEGFTTEQLRWVAGRLAGEPLTRTAIREVTRTARQFLDGPAPDGPFRVYHQSFADFLIDPEQNPGFLIDAGETHEAIVAAYTATDPLGWDDYARRNLALHASEAGRLDHLLEDARFLLAADPARLVPHLDAARSAPARAAATVYRRNAHILPDLESPMRASQLELTARQLGYRALADSIAGAAPDRPWQTNWSHSLQAADHQVLTGHRGAVSAVAAGTLPDGTPVIISGSDDMTVRVWRLADGSPAGEPLTGHDGLVSAVAAGTLPDGTPVIISGGSFDDQTVRVWRTADGSPVGEPLRGHDSAVSAVAAGALRDGTPVIISGSYDQTVRVWRLADGTPVAEPLRGHHGPVQAVAAGTLPDGTPVIISGGHDMTVRVWRLADGSPVGEPLRGHQGTVQAVAAAALSNGTPVIISGGSGHDMTMQVWRLADGTPLAEPLRGHQGTVQAVAAGALSDGTPVIISGGLDGTVRVWRLADGTPVGEPLRGHDGEVNAVAAGTLPDGTPVIISGSYDQTVRVWRLADGTPAAEPLRGHEGTVQAVAAGALPDGTPVIISGSDDQTVRVWRLADGTPVKEPLRGHDGTVYAVAAGALPDGTPVIISGGHDRTVRVWRLADGTPAGEPLRGHHGPVNAVAAGELPDGTPVIISGGGFGDPTVRVWRLAGGTPVGQPLRGHESAVLAVAATVLPDDGPVIFSGGFGGLVLAWWLADGTPAGELRNHRGAVNAVAAGALPDGTPFIISGGDDGTVREGAAEPLRGHHGPVNAVAAGELPDGTPVIISGGGDGTVRVWRKTDGAPASEPMALLHSIKGVAVHGNVIVAAVGTGLIACQPTLAQPIR
ncbi:MAG TPA: AAA family ATPase [Streptosporangiaceae bacterium]